NTATGARTVGAGRKPPERRPSTWARRCVRITTPGSGESAAATGSPGRSCGRAGASTVRRRSRGSSSTPTAGRTGPATHGGTVHGYAGRESRHLGHRRSHRRVRGGGRRYPPPDGEWQRTPCPAPRRHAEAVEAGTRRGRLSSRPRRRLSRRWADARARNPKIRSMPYTRLVVWEFVFMMVVLKIPIV